MYVHGMPLIKSGSRAAVGENIREMQAAGHPHDQAVAAALSNARKYGAHMAGGGFTPPMGERFAQRQMMHQGFLHSTVPGRTDKLPISVKGGAYVLPADHVAALGQGNSLAGADIVNKMFKMGPYGTPPAALHGTGAKVPHLNLRAPMPHADGGAINPYAEGGAADSPYQVAGDVVDKSEYFQNLTKSNRYHNQGGFREGTPSAPIVPIKSADGGEIGYAEGGQGHGGEPTDIIAAGGEIVIPPEKIKEYFGDVDKGHKALDKWVKERRKHHIKELRTLKPPRKD